MRTIIGTCSCCGGRVSVPTVFMSVVPPVPTCESCGATQAAHGPVIQMQPAPPALRSRITFGSNTVRLHGGGSGG